MALKEDRDTLCHVLYTIFDLDDTAPLVKILKEEKWDILSFITESHLIITALNDSDANIPSWQLEYINIFSEYFYYRQEYGEPLHNNWKSLNKHDFEQWVKKYFPSFEKPLIQSTSDSSEIKIKDRMIQLTKVERQAALSHVLEILDHDENSPLTLCLKASSIEYIDNFISLPHSFIHTMTYQQVSKDSDGNNITTSVDVPYGYKNHVRVVQGYVSYRMNIGKPIDDWLTVTEEDIFKYMASREHQAYIRSCSSAATKMIHSHGEQHQTDITSGELKATNNSSSTTSNQIPSDLPISEITTANIFFSSPCGEDNSLVESSTVLNHNLWQCKTSASISSSSLKISENPKPSSNKDTIFTEHNQSKLQPCILKPASELPKETLLSYKKISFEPEYKTKSEYLQQIDPEPPPYMIQGNICRPNAHGLFTSLSSTDDNTASCTSVLLQPLQSKYIFSKTLQLSNKRMIFNLLFGMGSDIFIKAKIDPTIIYSYKTKLIMEQLDVQDSFSCESEKKDQQIELVTSK